MRRFAARSLIMGMALTIAVAIIGIGCKSKQAATQKPAAAARMSNEQMVRTTEESFRQVDPQAHVGVVLAVKSSDRLAAIGDVDAKVFHEGDAVTFIDAQRKTIDQGRVVNIVDGFVHVKYEPPAPGQRAPAEGDMAVRFSH